MDRVFNNKIEYLNLDEVKIAKEKEVAEEEVRLLGNRLVRKLLNKMNRIL